MKQILIEQAVLAVLGGATGIAVARLALPALVARIPAEVPRVGQIALDWNVLITVLVAAVGVALAVAVVPAVLTARPSLQPLLRQSRATDTPSRRRALGALVSTQIALAVVLGIGAVLMLRSLWNLQRVDPGFNPNGVLTFRLQTTSKYRALSTGLPYLRDVMTRVGALPGVTSVGAIAHLPLSNYAWTIGARRADQPLPAGTEPSNVGWRFIDRDYLRTMNIPVILWAGIHGRGHHHRRAGGDPQRHARAPVLRRCVAGHRPCHCAIRRDHARRTPGGGRRRGRRREASRA